MIEKYLLVIWIGAMQTQTLSTEQFATMAECEAVRAALYDFDRRFRGSDYIKCIPYTFKAE